jgi:uncharacterized membrane protein YfcA
MTFTMTTVFIYIAIGLGAGVLAGLFGVGGGLMIVPALVFLVGYTQMAAAGTSLVALLLPVGLGGVYAFYVAGKINSFHIKAGLIISIGMFVGSFFGAKIGLSFSDIVMKRAFCVFLVLVSIRMWFTTLA